jgi:hypothetical protein
MYHEQVEEFKKFASRTDAYEVICSKIAPSIFGEENVKKAVACLLFGGSRKVHILKLNQLIVYCLLMFEQLRCKCRICQMG